MTDAAPATPAQTREVAVSTQLRSVTAAMAERYGMESQAFEATLRGTVVPAGTTREEFAAFLLVAREYKLNPVTREIYAFPKKGGGIQPIVGVDGWSTITNNHPMFDGMDFADERDESGKPLWVECTMYRKDRSHPIKVREYLSECVKQTEPWKQWPYRMLRHKAMIQCARMAFGFSGIIDEDEAERLVDLGVATTHVAAPPRLKGGFGDAGDQTFRESPSDASGAASAGPGPDTTADSGAAHDAASPADDGVIDAEFEETPHDPATGEVLTVSDEVSDAVVDDPTASDAQAAADASGAAVSDDVTEEHPDQREGHATDPEETYVLAGEEANDKARRQTYRNGEPYSTVQAVNAGKLPEYKAHPPKAETSADSGFPGDAKKADPVSDAVSDDVPVETADDATRAISPVEVFNAMLDAATTWGEIKAALKGLSTTSAWSGMEPEGQRTIRLRIWDRVVDVRELGAKDTDPGADPQLFRVFGEVAADDEILMGTWNVLIRQPAYQGLSQEQKDGLKGFVGQRRAALAAAG